MPTTLPAPSSTGHVLSWSDLVQFYVLIARARWLHRRLMAADRRLVRLGRDEDGFTLLLVARRWLQCHEAIAALLGRSVPLDVERVRLAMRSGRRQPDVP